MDRDKDNAAPSEKFLSGFGTGVGGSPAYRRYARGAQKCYRPITTRLPFLAGTLILTLALIAIVEVVLRQYPADSDLGSLAASNITRRAGYDSNEDEKLGMYGSHQNRNFEARVPSISATGSSAPVSPGNSSTSDIGASSQIGAFSHTTTVSLSLNTNNGAYIPTSALSISSKTSPSSFTQIFTTGPDAYIPPTTIVKTSTTNPSAYISPSAPSFSPNTDPSAYIPTIVATTDASAYIPTVLATTDPSAYIPTFTTINGAYIPTIPSNSRSSIFTTSSEDTVSSAYVPTTPVVQSPSGGTYLSLGSPPPKSMHRTQTSAYIPSSDGAPQTTHGGLVPISQPLSVVTTITLPSDPPVSTTLTTIPGEYIPTTTPVGEGITTSGPQNGGETLSSDPGVIVSTGPANAKVSTQFANIPTSTINDPNAVVTSLVPVATHTSGGLAVVVLGLPSTPPLVPVSTYTSNGVAMVVMGSSSKLSLVPVSTYISNGAAYVVMGTQSKASLVPVSTYISNGAAYVVMGTPSTTSLVPVSTMTSNGVAVVILGLPTPQPTDTAALPSSYSVVVEQVTSTSGSVAYVYFTTLTLGPSQLASLTATATTPQNTAATTSDQQKTTIEFTNISYFAASYLPTMAAVAFRVLWTAVYNNARLMEPFYRLASPAGVTGKDALDNLYLSMGSIVPEPILALLSGHSYMLLVSTIAYLIELVAPLSSEFLGVDVHHGCIPVPLLAQTNHPCPARIVVHLVPARMLQGLLCLIAMFIILTMFLSRHRQSGVYSDPSSIAVMASLVHHPDVLQDFKHLNESDKELERTVKDQTYRLNHYQADGEGMKYGIVPTVKIIPPDVSTRGAYRVLPNPEGRANIRSPQRGLFTRHLFRTVGDISLAVLLLGIFGVTLGYYLDGNNDRFNDFFSSETFGPRFILTIAGGIAVSQWKRLEKEVRTLKPYRYLSKSCSSSPVNTILYTSPSTPYITLPLSIARFELFTALVAFCYILSEILVIMIVTIPYSSDEYWMAFLVGAYVSLSILGLQIITFTTMITWWRWTTPSLNRDPDTLMGVWTLLAASGIREEFEDMGTAGREDLVSTVVAWDKQYWLGEVAAKDGVMRTGIHSDAAHENMRFERVRGERPPSPLPFSSPMLPTVPKITISSEI